MIIKYINSKGIEINLNKHPYKMLVSDLLDYEWTIVKSSNLISGFEKDISNRSINIDIWRTKQKSCRKNMNELTDIFEADISAETPGRLYIDDNYLVCYIYKSEKSDWETDLRMLCEYSLVTDKPFWITEVSRQFRPGTGSDSNALDYPHDYPYDYAPQISTGNIVNDNYVPADFRLTIFGPAVNPSVIIGGNIYKVYTELLENEYLVIDTQEQIVAQYDNVGGATIKFNSREKIYEIYTKIPPGVHEVYWPGDFGFDLTMYQKRSEPRWNL